MKRLLAFLLLLMVWHTHLSAQLPNEVLYDRIAPNAADSGRFGVALVQTSFMRNTEYFNPTEVGRTLFGYQLQPKIYWQPASNLKLELGVFGRHDFGGGVGIRDVRPTFTVTVVQGAHQINFGTLQGTLSHGLLEPMMDISRVIENRLENGFQYRYQGSALWADHWINWENAIDPGAFDKERFTAGSHIRFRITHAESKNSVVLYNQFMASHQGGQIDTDTIQPFLMMVNDAAGIRMERKLSDRQTIYVDAAALLYRELSDSKILPKTNGTGLLINLGSTQGKNHFMFTYWQGQDFYAPRGTPFYMSRSLVKPANYQSNRNLLFFRWIRNTNVFHTQLEASMRFEPVLDIDRNILDYSYSLYLVYHLHKSF